ncbi:hypothetical protein [uncultured Fibrella sp.]|uniref:hypothetical protein n=1 Tax=uncultured Fibrella sp. TaxID=1284596 RepID=UPI0035CB7193
MKKQLFIRFSLLILVLVASCKQKVDPEPTYTIVNNGNGGVTTITDTKDKTALDMAQAVPSVSGATYPANMPLLFFLDDKVYLTSIQNNFVVKVDGVIVGGTISVNEAANGFAILTFSPKVPFKGGQTIEVTLKDGMQDDGGNGFYTDFVLTYNTSAGAVDSFDTNKGFESGSTGVVFVGDGGVLTGTVGSISPQSGNRFGAITSGSRLVSTSTAAGDASSTMILGPINTSLTSLSFNYNFISAEFNDYVGTQFDDTAMFTVYGPKGAYSTFVNSVNTIAKNNNKVTFPGMPDGGDSYVGATGWLSKKYTFNDVGSPAFVVFTATDVSDTRLSTILAVDNLSY